MPDGFLSRLGFGKKEEAPKQTYEHKGKDGHGTGMTANDYYGGSGSEDESTSRKKALEKHKSRGSKITGARASNNKKSTKSASLGSLSD